MISAVKYIEAPFIRSFFYGFIGAVSILLSSCTSDVREIRGQGQGTTYSVKYYGQREITKVEIDSILKAVDHSLSLWDSTSLLSQFNRASEIAQMDIHFFRNISVSQYVWQITRGSFNPFIKPLVDYWGFGEQMHEVEKPDTNLVDSLRNLLSPYSIKFFDGDQYTSLKELQNSRLNPMKILVKKETPAIKLDFNGVAQGYTVDIISEYLLKNGIENFLIELGGEMRSLGVRQDGQKWRAGVDIPDENAIERRIQAVISFSNEALATSGNYRKYYDSGSLRVHHTLNPATGFPAQNDMLSATVLHKECAFADAYATAFMVMGSEQTRAFLESNEAMLIEAYLIYKESDSLKTWMSEGMKQRISEITPEP